MRPSVLAAVVLCVVIGGAAPGARAHDDEGWRSHDRPRGRDREHHVVVDQDGRPAQSDAVVGPRLAPMRPYWGQMRPYWGPTQLDRPTGNRLDGRKLK